MNVSIHLFFSYKNKTSSGGGEGEVSSIFRWGGVGWCLMIIEMIIVSNVSVVRHSLCRSTTPVNFEKKVPNDSVACANVCIYNPTQISIRFLWLSKFVAPVDPTSIFSMLLFVVHYFLGLNIQSVLYTETTKGKLKRAPYEQLSVI